MGKISTIGFVVNVMTTSTSSLQIKRYYLYHHDSGFDPGEQRAYVLNDFHALGEGPCPAF